MLPEICSRVFTSVLTPSQGHLPVCAFRKPVLPYARVLTIILNCFLQEIKQKQRTQEDLSSRARALPLPDVVPEGDQGHYRLPALNRNAPLGEAAAPQPLALQQANRNHGLFGGALANLFVIVGFAAFAYTVKYVLRSIAQD